MNATNALSSATSTSAALPEERSSKSVVERIAPLTTALSLALILPQWMADCGYSRLPTEVVSLFGFIGAITAIAPRWIEKIWGATTVNEEGSSETLVAMGLLAALVSGEFSTVVLIGFILDVGHSLENTAWRGPAVALALRASLGTAAHVRRNGVERDVAITNLRTGDIVICDAQQPIPCDGDVLAGASSVDESSLTGEPTPRDVLRRDVVRAGTKNLVAPIEVRAMAVGSETCFGQICDELDRPSNTSLSGTKPVQCLLDDLVPFGILCAAITYLFTYDMQRVMALWIVMCPCALLAAAPSATWAALDALRRMGILVRQRSVLNRLTKAKTIVFDKTGTLTTGEMSVADIDAAPDSSVEEVMRAAIYCAEASSHPISRAIAKYGRRFEVDRSKYDDDGCREEIGGGVEAVVEGQTFRMGNDHWMRKQGIDVPYEDMEERGPRVSVAYNDRLLGRVTLQDPVRTSAESLIRSLRQRFQFTRIALLTGDRSSVAKTVASHLAMDDVRGDATPMLKRQVLKDWMATRGHTLYVGDGINDSLALSEADVGIAFGLRTHVGTRAVAHVQILADDLRRIELLLVTARLTQRVTKQNVAMAVAYMVLLILASVSGELSPVGGAIVHHGVTALVLMNSTRLWWVLRKYSRTYLNESDETK